MGFFKGHKGRRSYDLLSNYNHFMPGYADLIWIVLLILVGAFIGSMILMPFTLNGYEHEVATYGILISYPLMFIPAMLYASAKSRRNEGFVESYTLDNNNFGSHKGITMTFAAIVMTIATAFIVDPVGKLLPEMPAEMEALFKQLLGGPAWVTLISVSIFAPFFEEWLCRGVVLRGLLKKVGPVWAIIISALFFAAIHMNMWQAIPAFIMGLVFGYVYYKTGSLKLTMLMHCVNNTMAFVVSRIPSFENAEYFSDVLSPWAFGAVYAVAVIALAAGIIFIKGIPQKDGNLGGCRKIDSIF
jgi:membrane protease YdiL (CAAX protease family)